MNRTPIQRLQIRARHFVRAPELQTPLNDALVAIQDQVAVATDGVVQLRPLPPVEVTVTSNTPGTGPWPLRLTQAVGSPLGVVLLRCENLSTAGTAGVGTAAVSITSQRVDAGTVFVDFVSGLTLNSRYRMVFGVYNA